MEPRPGEMANSKLATGEIEVRSTSIVVLNKSKTPPFPLDDEEAMLNYDFNFSYTSVKRLEAFKDPANLGSN